MKKLIVFLLILLSIVLFAGCQEKLEPKPITNIGDGPWLIRTQYPTADAVIADIIVEPESYSVDPTGKEDSTLAIQQALNDARRMGGGTVWLPAGQYRITGSLSIPAFVTLRGDWQDPDQGNKYGTILLMDIPTLTEKNQTGSIYISGSAGAMGLTVYYPNQSLEKVQPYPFTFYVSGLGDGYMMQSVINCTLINAYKGIGACVQEGTPHEMLTIENVKGTVLSVGAEIYNQADVGTWKGVHFGPDYWADAPEAFAPPNKTQLTEYTRSKTVGFRFGDLEWTQLANIRLSDMKIGIHAVKGKRIEFAGSIYDAQVTNCGTAMLIDHMDERWGCVIAKSTLSGDRSLVNNTGGQARLTAVTLVGPSTGTILADTTDESRFIQVPSRNPQKPADNLCVVQADRTGKTDISESLQAALNSLAGKGGVVYLPAGLYRLEKTITVPAGVELRGASSVGQREQNGNSNGTLILVYPVACSDDIEAALAEAMVTLDGDHAGIRGVRFLYPKNITSASNSKAVAISAYTIRGKGTGVYAVNVAITAGYNGIDFKDCDGYIIKRLVGSCVSNAMRVGGKGGLIEGCLQNGNTFCRMGISKQLVTLVPEVEVFNLVFDPILRIRSTFIHVQSGAEDQIIFNSFAYGVKTLVSSGGEVTIFNVGADNLGAGSPMFDVWGGRLHATNMMRYNGISYRCRNSSALLYNRLTILDKSEPQTVLED